MPRSQYVLKFNGHDHYIDSVIASCRTAPVIEVSPEEIHPLVNDPHAVVFEIPTSSQDLLSMTEAATNNQILLYKQNGKYVVLLGREKVATASNKSTIRGKLLSTVGLKKTRIVEMVDVNPEPEIKKTGYLGNKPRWAEPRQSKIN